MLLARVSDALLPGFASLTRGLHVFRADGGAMAPFTPRAGGSMPAGSASETRASSAENRFGVVVKFFYGRQQPFGAGPSLGEKKDETGRFVALF